MALPGVPNLQFDQDTIAKFQKAKQAGVPDAVNYRKATEYQMSKTRNKPKTMQDNLLDLLPLAGGLAGSFVPGAGTIIGGGLGAGAATILKQKLKGQDINLGEAGKEAALSAAGGVVGKGLGFVGGKLLGKAAPAAADLGETLAAKAFRVNPGQATKFAEETGEEFGKFLVKRGITNPNNLDDAIRVLQEPFDQVVESSNILIKPERVLGKFAEKVGKLNKSIIPADREKAKVLENIGLNFIDQYGQGPIDAKALTLLRRELDEGISKFALDESVKGPLNLTRDVLQNSLREVADEAGIKVGGMSLKDSGVELSKLYKAQEIATRQGNLGVGSAPAGILKLLGGAAGGAAGGVPGAITGMAATSALNEPANIGLLSKLFTGASKAAGGIPRIPESSVPSLIRGGAATGTLLGMPQEAEAMGSLPQPQPGGLPQPSTFSDLTQAQTPGAGMAGGAGQEDQLRQIIGQMMFSKAKSVNDIKAAYEFMNPSSTQKPLTGEQQKVKANAESGLRSLSTVESILAQDPTAPLKANIPIVKGRSPYGAAAKDVADVLTRLRTGAALNDSELAFYQSQLPQVYDSPETVQYKLSLFRNLFQQLAYGQSPAVPEVDQSQALPF